VSHAGSEVTYRSEQLTAGSVRAARIALLESLLCFVRFLRLGRFVLSGPIHRHAFPVHSPC
jgi:hypothetical protein